MTDVASSSSECCDRSSDRTTGCSRGRTDGRSRSCGGGHSCSWSTLGRSYWANSSGRGVTSCDVGNVVTRTGGSGNTDYSVSDGRGCCDTDCDCDTRRTRRSDSRIFRTAYREYMRRVRYILHMHSSGIASVPFTVTRGSYTYMACYHPAKPHRFRKTREQHNDVATLKQLSAVFAAFTISNRRKNSVLSKKYLAAFDPLTPIYSQGNGLL